MVQAYQSESVPFGYAAQPAAQQAPQQVPNSLAQQIRQMWGGNWDEGGVDRAQELADLFGLQGIS
jgi:hypothetical protein